MSNIVADAIRTAIRYAADTHARATDRHGQSTQNIANAIGLRLGEVAYEQKTANVIELLKIHLTNPTIGDADPDFTNQLFNTIAERIGFVRTKPE